MILRLLSSLAWHETGFVRGVTSLGGKNTRAKVHPAFFAPKFGLRKAPALGEPINEAINEPIPGKAAEPKAAEPISENPELEFEKLWNKHNLADSEIADSEIADSEYHILPVRYAADLERFVLQSTEAYQREYDELLEGIGKVTPSDRNVVPSGSETPRQTSPPASGVKSGYQDSTVAVSTVAVHSTVTVSTTEADSTTVAVPSGSSRVVKPGAGEPVHPGSAGAHSPAVLGEVEKVSDNPIADIMRTVHRLLARDAVAHVKTAVQVQAVSPREKTGGSTAGDPSGFTSPSAGSSQPVLLTTGAWLLGKKKSFRWSRGIVNFRISLIHPGSSS